MVKKGMVMAATLGVLATTAISTAPDATNPVSVTTDYSGISVQELYRPVLNERIPESPQQRGDKSWRWWTEQLKRIKYGWTAPNGHYLCGFHYWYLNFVKIPRQDKDTNTITGWDAPYYRDNDDEIFSQLWRNRYINLPNGSHKNAVNHVEAKARTIGWTQIEFLGVDMYLFIFQAGRERYIGRGYPDEDNLPAERNWFRKLYEQLPAFLKTWGGKNLEVLYNNDDQFTVGWKVDGRPVVHNSLWYVNVSDEKKAGRFKGQRLTKITAVEAGKWVGDSLDNFYVENKDCLEGGDTKWGMMVIGGTSNAIINKSTNYKRMFFDPASINATTHFTPKTKALLGYIDLHTGRSKVEEAYQFVMMLRRQVEGNAALYQKMIIENPLTPLEAFTPNLSFAYDQAKINEQIAYVQQHGLDKLWIRGKLEYDRDGNGQRMESRVVFKEEKDGPWLINRAGLPQKGFRNLHIAGIDDTYLNKQEGQKLRARDSRNCMIIYRQPTLELTNCDMPVAVYWDKATDMYETYNEFLKGMKLYDVQQALYEFNQWGFVNWLRDKAESNRLWWINERTPGIQVKGKMKSELTSYGYEYLAEDRHLNITCMPILESLLVWGNGENNDYGSAFHLVLGLLHFTKDWVVEREDPLPDSFNEYHNQRRSEDFIRAGQLASDYREAMPRQSEDYIRIGAARHRQQYI